MDFESLRDRLISTFEGFDIIDCHEHLQSESVRLDSQPDVFNLFSHYTRGDLLAAGMSEADYRSLSDKETPVERRWALFAPFWEQIRYGSYARAALIAAKKFYGFDEINEITYRPLSEAIGDANTPGLYQRVLGDACGIRAALSQCGETKLDPAILKPVAYADFGASTWEELAHPTFFPDGSINTLDDYLGQLRDYIIGAIADGAVGLKTRSRPYGEPDRKAAEEAFEALRTGRVKQFPEYWLSFQSPANPIKDYILDQTLVYAEEFDLTVAVHTGYWGDFRRLLPELMIPTIIRHPNTRFDIFHLGYPAVRECLQLGKNFPNVWLNLAWTHIISQRFASDAIDEAIDLIPSNKILAFGGDYSSPAVEKVYGHLTMAREDIAGVLARRIMNGRMTEDQAVGLARKWFWDNPKELYRLDV